MRSKSTKKTEEKLFCMRKLSFSSAFWVFLCAEDYFLRPLNSSETVSFLRPLARREANTRRPLAVVIRSRKPCLFFLLRLCGWKVLFIAVSCIIYLRGRCQTLVVKTLGCPLLFFAAAKVNINFFKSQKTEPQSENSFVFIPVKALSAAS